MWLRRVIGPRPSRSESKTDTPPRNHRSLVRLYRCESGAYRARTSLRMCVAALGLWLSISSRRAWEIAYESTREVAAGAYDPPVEPATLGYAIVRLAEAFLFSDAGMRSDVDRLREVEAAILGVPIRQRQA